VSEPPVDPTTAAAAGIGAKRQRAPGAGRPRKSAALHYLEGTRSRAPQRGRNKQSHARAAAPADPALVTPPRLLPKRARAFWLLNAPQLAACGRLQLHHLSFWTMLCVRFADWELAEYRLHRLSPSDDSYATVAGVAARACDQVRSMAARFGLDYLSDVRLSGIDGSSVGGQAPAAELPKEARDEDPMERWEREFARGG